MPEPRQSKTEHIADATIRIFPALTDLIRKWSEEWAFNTAMENGDPPGLHTFFGQVFHQELLIPALEAQPEDGQLLDRIFKFIEALAASKDGDMENVVEVSICETIGDDRAHLERARRYMGPATLAASKRAESFLGRE